MTKAVDCAQASLPMKANKAKIITLRMLLLF